MSDDLLALVFDDLLRLGVATIAGMIVGLNREVRGKALGMRTLGLVAMGSALVGVAAIEYADLKSHPEAAARVVQGIVVGVMTGIGFLGAGSIIRDRSGGQVHGLTTAATAWVAAAIGVASALAAWHLVIAGVGVALLILMIRPLERGLARWLGAEPEDRATPPEPAGGPGAAEVAPGRPARVDP